MSWVLRRPAARVVLLDPTGRVFLLRASDPARPADGRWWEIPGGGMSPGESSADAARRELYEETGIRDVEMGPLVWTQQVRFQFGGLRFDSHDHIHVAWCDGGEYRPAALEALEALAFETARWWELDELLASTERLIPIRMREFLPDLVEGRLPPAPIDIVDPTAHEW